MSDVIDIIDVGRTAMIRTNLSRPVRLALEDRVLGDEDRFFDYGQGTGGDVERLIDRGVNAAGWDPNHHPDGELVEADVVNIGYVINVIPDPAERAAALKGAWRLTERVLVVSARLTDEEKTLAAASRVGDGWVTGNGTFQKFYTQTELRMLLAEVLDRDPVAAAPGVFYVFRDEDDAQQFLADRRRRRRRRVYDPTRVLHPKRSVRDDQWDTHSDRLAPLMEFYTDRGRLPRPEDPDPPAHPDQLGTAKQAWQVVTHATDPTQWERITEQRADELTLDLALGRLHRRPKFSGLPPAMQGDVREFFGSYKAACEHADRLLTSAGDPDVLRAAADASPVGKVTPEAIYVHHTALSDLPVVLQAYEGAARWLLGDIDHTLVKLAWNKPRVSYLTYADFDSDPHPRLLGSVVVKLERLNYRIINYANSDNPPILHRKELFVAEDYPGRDKFARLTAQEERYHLYDFPKTIGTVDGWRQTLEAEGVSLRGHRVIKTGE